jgi:3-methyladenine DNA glycosylase AlkD
MIVEEIKDRLRECSDPEKARRMRVHCQRLYQEMPELYGVATPIVRQLLSEFFQKVKKKPKMEILQFCNELLRSGLSEERTIAFGWAFRLRRVYEESDFKLLESWLMKHVHGWGACDDLCTHALGAFIHRFPEFIQNTREWTRSKNRWVRRASAVCLIYSMRRKEHLGDIF